jgi:ferric-dicitrate binding protein FerR (iron transport regulator)
MNEERIFTLLSRKLSGEANATELAELDDLIKDFPGRKIPFEIMEECWNRTSEKDADFLEATYHLHLNRLKERGYNLEGTKKDDQENIYLDPPTPSFKQKYFRTLVLMCSILIITTALYFIFLAKSGKRNDFTKSDTVALTQSEVSTKNGSRTKIQLPDGTAVWLNGNSKLIYDNLHFGEKLREVTLTGEGYFDVVKNPEKPFVIHTSKMDIKVLGTIFNVRCYPDEKNTETSLIRGSIEVTLKTRKEKIMLKPSEKLILTDDIAEVPVINSNGIKAAPKPSSEPIILLRHLTVLPQDSTIVETAWIENRLVFSGELFENVALKMENWYGVEIKFQDDKLKSEPLTATFKKETISEALHALQLTTKFNYKINNDIITISK